MKTDKFTWIYALAADPRLTESAKYFGTIIALKNLDPGGVTFRVRQQTIADNCAASERNVRRGFSALKETGWIELVDQRKRGRGNHGADQYRLTIPVIPDRLAAIPAEEIPDRTDRNTGQNRPKYRTESTEIPDRADAVNSENYDPKGISKGISKGFERGSDVDCADAAPTPMSSPEEEQQQPDDPEPPLFCPKHPYGTVNGKAPKCGPCGTHRIANEEWRKRHPEADAAPAPTSPVSTLNPDCRICGGDGFVLGQDRTPIEPATACRLCRPHKASAAGELIDHLGVDDLGVEEDGVVA